MYIKQSLHYRRLHLPVYFSSRTTSRNFSTSAGISWG
jgi:hypothetical protein